MQITGFGRNAVGYLSLVFDLSATSLSEIESTVAREGYALDQIVIRPGQAGELDRVDLIFGAGTKNLSPLLDNLRRFGGVRQISSGKSTRIKLFFSKLVASYAVVQLTQKCLVAECPCSLNRRTARY